MSKYVVMFSIYDDRYYNVFPVAKIIEDYNSPFLENIWTNYEETRKEISLFLPGTDRNVNIKYSPNQRRDIQQTIEDGTWAVMNLDKALEHIIWDNNHNKLPFDYFDDVFEEFKENGLYFLKGKAATDSDCMPLYINDHYMELSSGDEFIGPFIEGNEERANGYNTWQSSTPPQDLTCNVIYNYGSYNEVKEHYTASFIFKSFLSLKYKFRIQREPISMSENGSTPDAVAIPETVSHLQGKPEKEGLFSGIDKELCCENPYLVSKDYNFGTYAEEVSKIVKEFKAKQFKKDVETKTDIEVYKFLFNSDVINADILKLLRKQKKYREQKDCERILSSQHGVGYLSKVKSDRYGTLYTISDFGTKAYEHDMDCKHIGVQNHKYVKPESHIIDARSAAIRFAYAKFMEEILNEIEITSISCKFLTNSFLVSFEDKEKKERSLIIGSFENTVEDFQILADTIKESLNDVKLADAARLFVIGITSDQTKALRDELYSLSNILPGCSFCYVFENGTLYRDDASTPMELTSALKETVAPAEEIIDIVQEQQPEVISDIETQFSDVIAREVKVEEHIKELEAKTKAAEEKLHETELLLGHTVDQLDQAEAEVNQKKDEIKFLASQKRDILDDARKSLNKPEFARVVVDGYLASQLTEAAARWGEEQEKDDFAKYKYDISMLESETDDVNVADYIVEKIQKARPAYSRNDILNIAICFTQGLITVFSGTPGSGKTSICNIMAQVLGLDKPVGDHVYSRYVPISVGRGWTSQRDFIGYYNPLTKEFDKSNQQSFNAFVIGDMEGTSSKYPIVIMLDEANLSPMEYYWSEFIRICDDKGSNPYINCGGKRTFFIPRTLRFFATINNDDTTTTLSPRMIDRSWIITLPELTLEDLLEKKSTEFSDNELLRISYSDMEKSFGVKQLSRDKEKQIVDVLKGIIDIDSSISINHRSYKAIVDYCSAAEGIFDNGTSALDYAIAQRILPKIDGANSIGSNYGETLKKLNDYLSNDLKFELSSGILARIIDRGNDVGYYQFF